MKKIKDEKLFKFIRDFLVVYLSKQRCYSNDTVKSYRETLNILLDYITREKMCHWNISHFDCSIIK